MQHMAASPWLAGARGLLAAACQAAPISGGGPAGEGAGPRAEGRGAGGARDEPGGVHGHGRQKHNTAKFILTL